MRNRLLYFGFLIIGFVFGASVPKAHALLMWDNGGYEWESHGSEWETSVRLASCSAQLDVCEQQLADANDSWFIPNFIEDNF